MSWRRRYELVFYSIYTVGGRGEGDKNKGGLDSHTALIINVLLTVSAQTCHLYVILINLALLYNRAIINSNFE